MNGITYLLWLVTSAVVAILTSIIASVLMQRFSLASNETQWQLIVGAFVLTLLIQYIIGKPKNRNRNESPFTNNDDDSAEISDTRKLLDINFVDTSCFVESTDPEHSDMISWKQVFDWRKWRFLWVLNGAEQYLTSTVTIFNPNPEPIYIRKIRASITRIYLSKSLVSSFIFGDYPSQEMRLVDQGSSRNISLDPWYRINSNEKLLWDLWIDLSVESSNLNEISYLEKLELLFVCDNGKQLEEIRLIDGDRKDIQWRSVDTV